MFILRIFLGFLIGYIIYYGSFIYSECLMKYHTASKQYFLKELHHSDKRKPDFSCVIMMSGSVLLIWISNIYYAEAWQVAVVYSFILCLLVIAYIDIRTMRIPNQCLWLLSMIGLCFLIPPFACTWSQRIYGMFIASGLMLLVNLLQRDSFGYGDIKLMMICGFYLGAECTITAMLLAIISGGIYALCLLIIQKVKLQTRIAFAPFLCMAQIIAFFIGNDIINMYLMIFY